MNIELFNLDFSKYVRICRLMTELSRAEVAQLTGISPMRLHKIETGYEPTHIEREALQQAFITSGFVA